MSPEIESSLCVYLDLSSEFSLELWNEMLSLVRKEHLSEKGKEYFPHVTLLYSTEFKTKGGFKDLEKISRRLPLKLEFDSFGVFENDEYDVLYVGVKKSSKLNSAREVLILNYEAKINYPSYVPHLTLAYLKSGFGKLYQNKFSSRYKRFEELNSDTLVYSLKGEQNLKFSIQNNL